MTQTRARTRTPRRDPAAWGVGETWTDAGGRERRLAPRTVEALLDALGADAPRPQHDRGPLVVRVGGDGPGHEGADGFSSGSPGRQRSRGAAASRGASIEGPLGSARRRADLAATPSVPTTLFAPATQPGPARLSAPAELVLEDGTRLAAADTLPPDLPLGYHRLEPLDGDGRQLICAPQRCHLDPTTRAFGLAVQLYALRSSASWGIGDLADLRELGAFAASRGAAFALINPLHAPLPGCPQQPSPYSPSSRRFRTPLALRIEEVTGYAARTDALAPLARAGRALSRRSRIDRDAIWRLELQALELLEADHAAAAALAAAASAPNNAAALPAASASASAHPALLRDAALATAASTPAHVARPDARAHVALLGDPANLTAYRRARGRPLELFALHSALVEEQGRDWRRWPPELRSPSAPGIAAAERRLRRRVDFHAFVQWQLEAQLAAAAEAIPLMHDLAVGVDPAGADAWIDQDVLAGGVHVGAPPDEFNVRGQDWGLPPYDPWRLRAAGYAPFAQTLHAGMAHGGALRIDHVMGLFRLWWVPPGCAPDEGGYVAYPASEMLAVLALESVRAGATIVGEDLGTVDPAVREALAAHDVLSYRLLWFEDEPPSAYPARSMAALTTHDLPTVHGLLDGSDLANQRRCGMRPDSSAEERVRQRALAAADPGPNATPRPAPPPATVVRALHSALAAGSSMLVAGTLDDLTLARDRPNMPGTVDEWPNWQIPLPMRLERIVRDPGVRRRLDALRRADPKP